VSTPAFRFDGLNPEAQRVAERQAAAMVTAISEETRAAIRALIARSIREGIPPYDAGRMIRGMIGLTDRQAQAAANYREELINQGLEMGRVNTLLDRYVEKKIRDRAESIARTETMAALNEGSRESWRQAQEEGLLGKDAKKEWIVTPDDRLCPNCAPMDGVQVPLEAKFHTPLGDVDGPPLHPQCLPGDALVLACGRVTAQSERRYDGDLLIIHTAGGKQLACSPNHPILTPGGWLAAHALHVGGHVVGSPFREWESFRRDVHDKNVPARLQDVAKASRRSQQMAATPVPLTPEDFHGDGRGSKVAVVRTNRLLRNRLDATRQQHRSQVDLRGRTVKGFRLYNSRALDLFGYGMLSATRCRVCGRNLTFPRRGVHRRPLQRLGGGVIADRYTSTNEARPDRRTGASVELGDRIFRPAGAVPFGNLGYRQASSSRLSQQGASLPMGQDFGRGSPGHPKLRGHSLSAERRASIEEGAPNDLVADSKLARDLTDGASGPVFADRVCGIDTQAFHGVLFNLETSAGAYWANGILTHNCRCVPVAVP